MDYRIYAYCMGPREVNVRTSSPDSTDNGWMPDPCKHINHGKTVIEENIVESVLELIMDAINNDHARSIIGQALSMD